MPEIFVHYSPAVFRSNKKGAVACAFFHFDLISGYGMRHGNFRVAPDCLRTMFIYAKSILKGACPQY